MMVSNNGVGRPAPHHQETTMDHYAGIDVSLEYSSVCVVDATGKIVREAKVLSEPAAMISWVGSLGLSLVRIGLEAGQLSQGGQRRPLRRPHAMAPNPRGHASLCPPADSNRSKSALIANSVPS